MRQRSPRACSSARARSRRRAKTSGEREGSWAIPVRNAECGVRSSTLDLRLRTPNSALRTEYATSAPRRPWKARLSTHFEARIEPLDGKLPKVTYHWDPETDILSVACQGTGKATSFNGTVDLEGNDGSFVVIDVASGCLRGVDVVTWPDDIRTHEQLAAPVPAKDARVVFPTHKAQPAVAAVEVDTPLTVEKNQAESVLHIRVGRQRPATVVRVADRLLVEVDRSSRLAGLWFLDVPPFPNVEATA